MARWEPGTRTRLINAALELYTEYGYDSVTITQIAERAGITRRSYFRYFPDKREVLFDGSERLPPALAEAVLNVAETTAPLPAAIEALSRIGSQLTELVDHSTERRAVIDANPELLERERTKLAELTSAIEDAVAQRGTDAATAHLVAQVATAAFENAFTRWVDANGDQSFTTCLTTVVASLTEQFEAR